MKKTERISGIAKICFLILMAIFLGSHLAQAKSLYVIANINGNPTPIQTYDIQSAPVYLVYQAEAKVPNLASGAVGLAIDTTNRKLFVTYESGNKIQLLDATNFKDLGTTTAPGASDLAGIAVDQSKNKVYTVDRNKNKLYVYDWNSSTNTLTQVSGSPFSLPNVSAAFGIALDETRSRLYIGDISSTTVRYFNTSTWAEAGNFSIPASDQKPMGIAVDTLRNVVYTGNASSSYGSKGKLVKYDLNSATESSYILPGATSGDNIVGLAVDEDTGYVYATTGNQSSGGTDKVIVFSSNLSVLKETADIGDPTGIAIPRAQISYNPLNFAKTGPQSIASGANMDYNLCYDNTANNTPVTGLTITDTLPSGLTFVSATGGGTFSSGTVTWNLGTLPAGATQACVKLTVNVTATSGTITNNATIDSNETPPTTQGATTTIGGGPPPPPGSCQYFGEDFTGPSHTWTHNGVGNWIYSGGKLNVDQIPSGQEAQVYADFAVSDVFYVDVDVEAIVLASTNWYYGIEVSTSGDVLPSINGDATDAIGIIVYGDGTASIYWWDFAGEKWKFSSPFITSGLITSVGAEYASDGVTLRINKANTSLKISGFLSLVSVLDQIELFAAGTTANIRFDNICANPIGGGPPGGCVITSCNGTVPPSAQVGAPINVQAAANFSNCTGTPQYYWQFGETTARIPGQNIPYTFSNPGTWNWNMQVEVDGQSCVDYGTIAVSGQGGPCSYFSEDFTGPSHTWSTANANVTIQGGKLNISQITSGYIGIAETQFLPDDFFSVDVDVEVVSVGQGGGYGIFPSTTGDVLFSVNGKTLTGAGVVIDIDSGGAYLLGWDISSGWYTSSKFSITSPITSIGVSYSNNAITLRVNKQDTSLKWSTILPFMVIDKLRLFAQGTGTSVRFDNVCAGPIGGGPPGGCVITSCDGTAPASAQVGVPINVQATGSFSNCTGTPQYYWQFGETTARIPGQNMPYTYSTPGTWGWTMAVEVDGKTCVDYGTIMVTGGNPNCTINSCDGIVPATAQVGNQINVQATASFSNCTGTPQYYWQFGETTARIPGQNIPYTYMTAGTWPWNMQVEVDGKTCVDLGTITVSSGGSTGSTVRNLPPCYPPSGPMLVTIIVTPTAATLSYAVEDSPPANWTVSNISSPGLWDSVNKKVKWGPFFGNNNGQPHTLTYYVTPPPGESGPKSFSGTASFNGVNQPIGGTSTLDKCSGIYHPADTNADNRIVIAEMTAYGGAWKSPGAAWPTPPSPIPIEYVTNAGYIWMAGETYHYDSATYPPFNPGLADARAGLSRISPKIAVPLTAGSASRDLPGCYTPSSATIVSITVNPSGASAYAVEDAPPNGWTVSNISEQGQWDSFNKKVKWLFFDSTARTFTYQATPPAGQTGTKTFSGIASFDGTNVTITGDSNLAQCTTPPPPSNLPDLTGQWTAPPVCNSKGKCSGTFTVSNIGTQAASASTVTYHLSTDQTLDATDTFLTQVPTKALKPGMSKAAKFKYTVSGATGKFIIAVIDEGHTLQEADEANNIIPSPAIP